MSLLTSVIAVRISSEPRGKSCANASRRFWGYDPDAVAKAYEGLVKYIVEQYPGELERHRGVFLVF